MREQIQISAKNLGAMAMPTFCQRCFWIRLRDPLPLPFQIFPGIFSSLDSYGKKVAVLTYERYQHAPNWVDRYIGAGSVPVKVPHWSKFKTYDTETDIVLTGVPDELWRRPDGSLAIVDQKTARHTHGQDELLPIYVAQLNGYAMIAERVMDKVSWLGLEYFEPATDITADDLPDVADGDSVWLQFEPDVVEIGRDEELILRLLRDCRRIYDLPGPAGTTDGLH